MTTVLLHTGQTAPKLEPKPRPRPNVRVVRGGRHGLGRARSFFATTMRVLAVALLLGLVVSVVYSQAKITELNGQINDTQSELTAAKSEYDYLTTRMSDITSRASLQEVAEGKLGLVKLDASQITYVQLEDESVIETASNGAGQFLESFRTAALSLLTALNP